MLVYGGPGELQDVADLIDRGYNSDVLDSEAYALLANAADRLDTIREWLAFELKVRRYAIAQDQQPDLFGDVAECAPCLVCGEYAPGHEPGCAVIDNVEVL